MADKLSDYDKSIIDIQIKFDEEREQEFKNILNKQFGSKVASSDSEEAGNQDKLEFLEADFSKREIELKKFRKGSQSAACAPILTQALVKKAKNRLNSTVISDSPLTALQKFRSIAKVIIIFMTLSKKWKRYDINRSEEDEQTKCATSANQKYFKASSAQFENNEKTSDSKKTTKSKYRVSEDLQAALKILPEQRENEDLIKIQRFCRKIGALSNFPVERELDVARYIGYESYDKGRVICLQNRQPDRFYFILSGRVNRVKTIELTSGIKKQYFGQLYQGTTTDANELQLKKPRECSLVCKTFVDLLLIEREDFCSLLATKSSLGNSNAAFVRSIGMFETFPLGTVGKDTMTTKYFPKDTVIIKDVYESPYFFIVKSGTCKLLQKHAVDKRGIPIVRKDLLPRINRGSIALSFTTNSTDENITLDEARQLHSDVSTFLGGSEQWNVNTDKNEVANKDVEIVKNRSKKSMKVTQARFGKPRAKASSRKGIPTLSELICGEKQEETRRRGSYTDEKPMRDPELKLPLITLNNSLVESSQYLMQGRETRRSTQISNNFPLVRKRDRDAFLQIGLLKKGDIYGLDSLMKRAASMVQAAVSLTVNPESSEKLNLVVISEGTECILVDKKSFLKSADFCTLARMVSMYQTHTSADQAKIQIEKTRNWGRYKRKIVKDILKKAKEKHKMFAYR